MKMNPILDLPRYLKIFYDYLGKKIFLFFILTLIAGLADSVGILMLLPLLQGVGKGLESPTQEVNGVYDLILNFISFIGLSESIETIVTIIILSFFAKGVFIYIANRFDVELRGELLKIIKFKLINGFDKMNYEYYLKHDTGFFINLINEQANRSVNSFQNLNGLGIQFVYTFLYLGMSFLMSWVFGSIMLLVGIVMLIVFRSLNHRVRDLSRHMTIENSNLSKMVIQFLHAFKYLTSIGESKRVKSKILSSIDGLTGYQIKMGYAASLTESVREPVTVVLIMMVVLFQVSILNEPLSNIFIAILFFYKGLNSILGVQASLQAMLESIGSIEIINDQLNSLSKNTRKDNGSISVNLEKNIIFQNVSYRYDGSKVNTIDSIDIDIQAYTSVALVGESGSGKSTLVDLITLVLRSQSGNVFIDNNKVEDIDLSIWRSQIGYVSQETIMFNDTIANNICLWDGEKNQESVNKKIINAANLAYISNYIDSLPDGYKTIVGDRGVKLSGGQRQRLFIARELYRNPNLLILDEATSALDSNSERQVQKSIDKLKGKITVIVIAHRLSTVRNVDCIYVIDKGRVIEKGSYEYLGDQEGSYFKKLLSMQNA
jgi:ABC-type multidrug transport system fused ATPase/permease subunit